MVSKCRAEKWFPAVLCVLLSLAPTLVVRASDEPSQGPERGDTVSGVVDDEAVSSPGESPAEGCELEEQDRDSDADGITDATELETGTDAFNEDTDEDGVPDGVEDADRDGVRDPGETDPRLPGLFPGRGPHIPEPMLFDLVRGLGARAGELEVNVLLEAAIRDPMHLDWAPEIEWAPVDDFAVELELPHVDERLESLKLAAQWTAPGATHNFIHGVQVLGELFVDHWVPVVTATYLAGGRTGSVSLFSMVGVRARATSLEQHGAWEAVVNPSVYLDLHESVTTGVEGNVAVALDGSAIVRLVPQVHWQVAREFRFQLGAGAALDHGSWSPFVATRLIVE